MGQFFRKIAGRLPAIFIVAVLIAAAVYGVISAVNDTSGNEPETINISGTGLDHLALEAIGKDGYTLTVFECRLGGPDGAECSQNIWEQLPVGTYRYQLRVAMRNSDGSPTNEAVGLVGNLTTEFLPWW